MVYDKEQFEKIEQEARELEEKEELESRVNDLSPEKIEFILNATIGLARQSKLKMRDERDLRITMQAIELSLQNLTDCLTYGDFVFVKKSDQANEYPNYLIIEFYENDCYFSKMLAIEDIIRAGFFVKNDDNKLCLKIGFKEGSLDISEKYIKGYHIKWLEDKGFIDIEHIYDERVNEFFHDIGVKK